jgi:hypothetical protein
MNWVLFYVQKTPKNTEFYSSIVKKEVNKFGCKMALIEKRYDVFTIFRYFRKSFSLKSISFLLQKNTSKYFKIHILSVIDVRGHFLFQKR